MSVRNQLSWINTALPGTPSGFAGWDASGNPAVSEVFELPSRGSLQLGSNDIDGGRFISVASQDANASLSVSSKGTSGLILNESGSFIQFGSLVSTVVCGFAISNNFNNESIRYTGRPGFNGAEHGASVCFVGGNGFAADSGRGGNVCLQGGQNESTLGSGNIIFNATSLTGNDAKGAERVIIIAPVSSPPSEAIPDMVALYNEDSSDGLATICLFTEQGVEAIGTFTPTNKLKIKINGVEYFIQLDAV